MRRVREALDRRRAEREQLKTPEQIAAYRRRLREALDAALGDFPPRTPLNAQVVGRQHGSGYRVEKVIYESRPRHYVTALLYLPDSPPPYPGICVCCGHAEEGKAYTEYQQLSILLARNGLAALCHDSLDEGERFQLLDTERKLPADPIVGHCLLGTGSALLGRNTATYLLWDAIRSLDYLQSRPEIDPERLGCTGNSGGGTLTSFLMALDQRVAAAALSCSLTTLRHLLETLGPQDAEQNLFAQVAAGPDHADWLLLRAPKPTLICAATQDYLDIDGTWETFRQAKRFYTRLGLPDRVDLIEIDGKHGITEASQRLLIRWLRRWLLGRDDLLTEAQPEPVAEGELQCTPTGQVMHLPEAQSAYDLNLAEEQRLAVARQTFWRQAGTARALEEVRRITGIRRLDQLPLPQCESLGSLTCKGYRVDRLLLRPEAGIDLPALAFVPDGPVEKRLLYLHPAGKQADGKGGGPIEKLLGQGHLVLTVDLRGLGEESGRGRPKLANFLGPDYPQQFLAYLLGTSYLAMRAEDILVCARFLGAYPAGRSARPVHLVAIETLIPPALHAAALEPELFASVVFRGELRSWADMLRTPLKTDQLVHVVHGALRVYDLPDLLAALPKENTPFWEHPSAPVRVR